MRILHDHQPCAAIPTTMTPSRARSTVPDAVGVRDDKTLSRPLLCTLRPTVNRTLELAYVSGTALGVPLNNGENLT
jgi:hypothetical protein